MRERTRGGDRLLQPHDGRRKARDRKQVTIRNADGATRSVRTMAGGQRMTTAKLLAVRWNEW
jgi:hypothetical protein